MHAMSNNNNQYIRLYNFKLFNFNIKLINCIGLFEQNYCSRREKDKIIIFISQTDIVSFN
jgi:hypothetical protein